MGSKGAHLHTLRDDTSNLAALDLSANFNTEATNILYQDNVGLVCTWTGTSPVGTLTVQASNDLTPKPTKWTTLTLDGTASVSGNSDSGVINLRELSFAWLRVVYARSSGTGTMTIDLCTKRLGA